MNLFDQAVHARERREQTAFPNDANRWIRLLFLFALPSMLLLRHHIGVRVVGMFKRLGMLSLLLLALFMDGETRGAFCPQQPPAHRYFCGTPKTFARTFARPLAPWPPSRWKKQYDAPFALFIWLVFLASVAHRVRRWTCGEEANKSNTQSMGVSLFSSPLFFIAAYDGERVERYIDPLVCVFAGWKLAALYPASWLAAWLYLSAAALFIVERYIRHKKLDRKDLIHDTSMQEPNISFRGGKFSPTDAPREPVTVPTGAVRREGKK